MTDRVKSERRRRQLLLASLAVAALVGAAPAQAQTASLTTYRIDIAAGPLDGALLRLAKQTGQEVFFTQALVTGRKAPALRGAYTPEQALAFLLASTDLTASRAGSHLLVLQRTTPSARTTIPVASTEPDRPFVTAQAGLTAEPKAPAPRASAIAPATPAAVAATTTVEAVEVTGSHIRGGAPVAAPLVTLSHDDLERLGQASVSDALRMLPANFGGGAAEGGNNGGSDKVGRNGVAGAAINLRGLGNNATLVLLDGRRLAGSGTFGDYVDVSNIPMAAVQRVEVLLDGASSAYGSDAVGGVVNIITRKNFDGAETRLFGGVATDGGPGQAQVSQTLGKQWSTGGVVLTYEFDHRDNLDGTDRNFANNPDLRPEGGSDQRSVFSFPGNIIVTDPVTKALVPGFGIPAGQNGVGLRPSALIAGSGNRSNTRLNEDLLPQQNLNAFYVNGHQEAGDRLELFADARYSDRAFRSHSAPFISAFTATSANPFYVSATGASSETIDYNWAGDLPNPMIFGRVETFGASAGGTMKLWGDWQADAYVAFAQERERARSSGIVNSVFLNEALGTTADNPATSFSTKTDGFFNPFTGIPGSNAASVLSFIGSGSTSASSRDQVTSIDLEANGTVWTLPAGPLKVALGTQARRETLLRYGTNFFSTVAPVAAAGTDVGRDITAGFVELRAPLFGPANALTGLQRLDLSIAARVEHYESFGSTANPKLGVVWAPIHDLELRTSYGRSFRAPALRELYDPATYTPSLFAVGSARVESLLLAGGNPTLKPETANSWTAGLDYRPAAIPGLTVSLTGYDIRFHNRIDRPVQSNLTNALVDPTLSAFVTRVSPATSASDRSLIAGLLASPFLNSASGSFPPEAFGAIVDNRYVNTTTLHVQGLDGSGVYGFDWRGDRVTLAANGTYVVRYDQQVTPTSQTFERVGLVNFPVRLRGRATADWTRGRLTLGGALNYTSAYHDSLGARIAEQETFDLQARLAPADSGLLKGINVLFNVRNVFNRDPPFYNNATGIAYDAANGDPIGRFVSLQFTRAW